jgi:hypothetical protein
MKKKGILLTAVILLTMAGFVQAQEELGITVDTTFVSKYLWRGFDKLDDKAAWQPSINLDLYDTGLSFNMFTSQPGSSGTGSGFLVGDAISTVDAEEWRYTLTYNNSILEGETYQTDWSLSWIYYDYPDATSENRDLQEYNLVLSWPDICPAGIVPHYAFVQLWPAQGGGDVASASGFVHVFGFSYDFAAPPILPDTTEQTLNLTWDVVFNDGAGGATVDHDWSHIVWGLSTAIECGPGTFTPAIYYQTSMEDSVNEENEFWTGLSYTVSF